ncbi:MAG: MarR family transcriptional regulator [Anaeromyxobacteraceae bacterium]
MRGLSTKESISSSRLADAERLLELLSALGRRSPLRDPVAGVVEDMQLTPVQIHALMWIGRDGPLTMGELARRLGSSERAVTGIVDRLERERLARRARAEDDRRVVRVHLERKGTAAYRALNARILERMAALLALLERDDCEALFGILERLGAVLGRAAAPVR